MKKISIKKLWVVILSILLLTGIGLMIYVINLPLVELKNDNITVEINSDFIALDNIEKTRKVDLEDVKIDDSNLDLNTLGTYTIVYTALDKSYEATVNVVDTIAPTFDTIDSETDETFALNAEDLVENIVDATQTTIKFKEEYSFDTEGDYEFIIIVTDEANNSTEKPVKVKIYKDDEAPVIKGDKEITKYQNASFDPMEGMSITDNRDANAKLEIISNDVDMKKVGTYKVEYEATDRSGNKSTFTKVVTVKEKIVDKDYYSGQNIVYLTFDDGPSYNTGKILKILDQYNIKATFFVAGYSSSHRQYIKQAYDAGHTIALHTYSHEYSDVYKSVDAYFKDLQKISDVVESLTGYKSPYIRFPGGSSNSISRNYFKVIMSTLVQEVRARGYQYYDWNVSSADASGSNVSTSKIINSSTSAASGELMILFHDTYGKDTTAAALPSIIEYYLNRGFTFKAIDESTPGFHHGVNN